MGVRPEVVWVGLGVCERARRPWEWVRFLCAERGTADRVSMAGASVIRTDGSSDSHLTRRYPRGEHDRDPASGFGKASVTARNVGSQTSRGGAHALSSAKCAD